MTEPLRTAAINPDNLKVLLDLFKELTKQGAEIAEQIPEIKKDVEEIETSKRELEEAAKSQEIHDPGVSQQISNCENCLIECTIFAKQFVSACVSMARYATQKKIADAIEEELGQGKFDTLITFIRAFKRQLAKCREKLREYVESHDRLTIKAVNYTKEWQERVEKRNAMAQAAMNRYITAEFVQRFARTTHLSITILPTVGAFVGSCLYYLTDYRKAALASLITGFAVPTVLRGSLYSLRLYNERRRFHAVDAFIENTGVKNMLERAQENIRKLRKTIDLNKQAIDKMTSEIDSANAAVQTIITEYIDSNVMLNTAGLEDIRNELTDFRSSMNQILETAGNNEENVSSDPSQVFSNTIAQQPSNSAETEPDEANKMDVEVSLPETDSGQEDSSLPAPISAQDTGGTATAIGIGTTPPTITVTNEEDEWDKGDGETQTEKEGSEDEAFEWSDEEQEVKKRHN